ncbi:uncharacterized protein DUF1841 [Blastococcus colisei]|uniref:Uncharacterized protein DUF1841 n=1 Tax=Blastococcus colisei TaxID=1564162 RepID=A0A543PDH5_9ACTN|nr:DUF1841 family protein [Blastococcus colisei]TQN42100.1 uncharacterized protein DUF1841 [Blastococcus colisei]
MQLLRELERELQDADALSAEITVSTLLGAARRARPDDPAGERGPTDLVADVVRQAGKVRRPTSLGLLRCLAVLGGPGERDLAVPGIRRLAAAGVPEPDWTTQLDDVAPTGAWTVHDVYGDAATIAVEFARPCRPHALVVLVDHTEGGIAAGAFLEDDPDDVRTERDRQGQDPLVVVEELDLGTARAQIEAAFRAVDTADPADVDDDLVATRALVLARLRALPAADPAPPAPRPLDEAALVGEFLASPEAAHLTTNATVERCAALIVAHRVEAEPANPLRISPGTLADLLLDRLLGADLSDDEAQAMPGVVLAWTRFTAGRTTLPSVARDHLVSAAEELADTYLVARSYPEFAERGPELAMSYAGDLLDDELDPAALEDAIARRTFAMPYVGTTIGGEDYPSLDPADPDDRGLLIAGEHPEYHAVLDDPFADGEIDGVNPRLHLAVHEMVANQLWDDDPPEAWQAAQRLLAAGMERHDVLHELAGVATELLWHALTDRGPLDLAAYRAALDGLDALPAPRSKRSVGRVPEGQQPLFDAPAAVPPRPTVVRGGGQGTRRGPDAGSRRATAYQLKIRLLGTKPPVWRRVLVPDDLTLAGLHDVIQVAMGWTDTHLHDFRVGDARYGDPGQLSGGWLDDSRDEAAVRVDQVLPRVGDRLRYTYDFGDDWEHEVLVESVEPAVGPVALRCLAGRRAGPPEDCGGVWGYADLCAAACNPDDPAAADRLEWLGHPFDPAHFDREAVDERLGALDRRHPEAGDRTRR